MAKNKLHDRKFRSKFIANPKKALREISYDMIEDIEYKAVESTKYVTYFVIPQQSNVDLSNISAAGNVLVSTVFTAGSVGTVCTCVGTLGSAGSYGTVDAGINVDLPIIK